MHVSNSIIKFADDTTVVSLITNNDENDVRALGVWCQENYLSLNVNKTKEMIVDFRKQQWEHPPSTSMGQLEVPRRTHHGQTEMVHPHKQQEGATEPLQPQEVKEIWLVT